MSRGRRRGPPAPWSCARPVRCQLPVDARASRAHRGDRPKLRPGAHPQHRHRRQCRAGLAPHPPPTTPSWWAPGCPLVPCAWGCCCCGWFRCSSIWRSTPAPPTAACVATPTTSSSAWARPLTQLANRAGVERLVEELRRQPDSSYPVSIVFLDIDRFKDINDAHTTSVGDAVLVQFAGVASPPAARRPGEPLGRRGVPDPDAPDHGGRGPPAPPSACVTAWPPRLGPRACTSPPVGAWPRLARPPRWPTACRPPMPPCTAPSVTGRDRVGRATKCVGFASHGRPPPPDNRDRARAHGPWLSILLVQAPILRHPSAASTAPPAPRWRRAGLRHPRPAGPPLCSVLHRNVGRFSYYGMRALLVLFLVTEGEQGRLGLEPGRCPEPLRHFTPARLPRLTRPSSAATSLTGCSRPALGATRRLHHRGRPTSPSSGHRAEFHRPGLSSLGTGLFKLNISAIVGQLYSTDSGPPRRRLHAVLHGREMGASFGILPVRLHRREAVLEPRLGLPACSDPRAAVPASRASSSAASVTGRPQQHRHRVKR